MYFLQHFALSCWRVTLFLLAVACNFNETYPWLSSQTSEVIGKQSMSSSLLVILFIYPLNSTFQLWMWSLIVADVSSCHFFQRHSLLLLELSPHLVKYTREFLDYRRTGKPPASFRISELQVYFCRISQHRCSKLSKNHSFLHFAFAF